MQKIVENYHVGEFITSHEPKHLAEKVKTILKRGEVLIFLNWKLLPKNCAGKNEAPKILELYERVAAQQRQFKFTKSSL
ncbi:MAG: hypothetical protein U0T78_04430 [Cloacibacterium normanense]